MFNFFRRHRLNIPGCDCIVFVILNEQIEKLTIVRATIDVFTKAHRLMISVDQGQRVRVWRNGEQLKTRGNFTEN